MSTLTSPPSADLFEIRRTTTPVPDEQREAALGRPGFGKFFTDHMVRVRWTKESGWHDRRVVPYGPLQLDPASAVLHYAPGDLRGAQGVPAPGRVGLDVPARGQRRPPRALGPPPRAARVLPEADFIGAIETLVRVDAGWVPSGEETSLYLRPFMFASESFLGVRPAHEVEFLVIASPGRRVLRGRREARDDLGRPDYHRAARGGTGAAKCGGNYAASLLPSRRPPTRAASRSASSTRSTNTWVEELGGMNLFFVYADGRVVTPQLSGTILEGVTRSSILELLASRATRSTSAGCAIDEVREGVAYGEITEVFACGTAAVITPIGRLASDGFDLVVARRRDRTGHDARCATELVDIQYGRARTRHGWMHRLV